MNLVDSSGWLAYLAGGSNADFFAPAIEDSANLVVPAVCLYEVFKRVLQQRGESAAHQAVSAMLGGQVVDVDASLALSAAKISLEHSLAMADSLILACARAHGATLWTQDADFAGMDSVRYVEKGTP